MTGRESTPVSKNDEENFIAQYTPNTPSEHPLSHIHLNIHACHLPELIVTVATAPVEPLGLKRSGVVEQSKLPAVAVGEAMSDYCHVKLN